LFYLASFLLEAQYVRVLTYKSEWWRADNIYFIYKVVTNMIR
jgi:hypothetical protein